MTFYGNAVEKLGRLLDQGKIRYGAVSGWQSLPDDLPGDLDMVVRPEDLPRLECLLGAESSWKIVQVNPESFFVLAVQKDGDHRFILLDAMAGFYSGADRRLYLESGEILGQAAREWNGLRLAPLEGEFAFHLAKMISKTRTDGHHRRRLHQLCSHLGESAGAPAEMVLGKAWAERATQWIRTADWRAWDGHGPEMKSAMRRHALKKRPWTQLRFALLTLKRIAYRWCLPRGFSMAILGPDGVGKSTLARKLASRLGRVFKGTAVFHMWPVAPMMIKSALRPVLSNSPRSRKPSFLLPLYLFLRYGFSYFVHVRPLLVKTRLVIFDRYYDDLLIDPKRYGYMGSGWFPRHLHPFVPKPHLILVLDAPPEQILARKQDLPIQEIRRQRDAYRLLAEKLPYAVSIDGSGTIEEVVHQAAEVVLNQLHRRYLRLRSTWARTWRIH